MGGLDGMAVTIVGGDRKINHSGKVAAGQSGSPKDLCAKARELGWSEEEQHQLRAIYAIAFDLEK